MVKEEEPCPTGCEIKFTLHRPFSFGIDLDQSMDKNMLKALTWRSCMCCNTAYVRVDIEDG